MEFLRLLCQRHADLRRTVPVHVVRPFVSGLCLLADASSDITSSQKVFSHLLSPHLVRSENFSPCRAYDIVDVFAAKVVK